MVALASQGDEIAQEAAALGERLQHSTVSVRNGQSGGGSGIIWTTDGLVITNAHVARSDRVEVELWDGRTFTGTVTAHDDRRDLAAVRIDAVGLPAAAVGDSDTLRPGQLVFAVGNPLGMRGALTTGIIHAVPANGRLPLVQADIHLAPGNSGGPLTDAAGRVIGINSMISGGLGLAVPSNAVQRFLSAGEGRPQLGIAFQPVPVMVGSDRVVGFLILEVAEGSPADVAGLIIGDTVIGVDERHYADPRDLLDAIRASASPVVPLEIIRGGARMNRELRLSPAAERSAGAAA